jgi:hypothetical protein
MSDQMIYIVVVMAIVLFLFYFLTRPTTTAG